MWNTRGKGCSSQPAGSAVGRAGRAGFVCGRSSPFVVGCGGVSLHQGLGKGMLGTGVTGWVDRGDDLQGDLKVERMVVIGWGETDFCFGKVDLISW